MNFDFYENSQNSVYCESVMGEQRRKNRFLSFGLPLGSALILIALLNTIFTLQSILNFVEVVAITGTFAAKHHLLYLIQVAIFLALTIYLWFAVIFTGRGYCLSIWIAGSLLLLLLKIVISSWTLLVVLSLKNNLYWHKLWALMVDIGMEIYMISVAVISANVMWRKDDIRRQFTRFGFLQSPSTSVSGPLPPIGTGPRPLFDFYYFQNIELGTRILILLDVIYSAHILTTETIPDFLSHSKPIMKEDSEIEISGSNFNFVLSEFGERRIFLIFAEGTLMRLLRIFLGAIAMTFFMRKKYIFSSPKKLGYILIAYIGLLSVSMIIYFFLFGLFESLSASDRFYQTGYTFDILMRLLIVAFLTKCLENRRLQYERQLTSEIAGPTMVYDPDNCFENAD